jgi:branched-chain amino acid transport system substrate-binding protein
MRKFDVALLVLFLVSIVLAASSLYYALSLSDALGRLEGRVEGMETNIAGLNGKVEDLWKEVFGKPPVKPPPLEGQTLKIGLILPLTGAQAPFGLRAKWGSEWAAEKINEVGIKGAKIQLFVEDNAGDPKVTVSATEKLITVDKCQVIRVAFQSPCILAAMEVCEKYEVPLVTITGSADAITQKGYKYIFRIGPNSTMAMLDDLLFLKEWIKPKRLAILHEPGVYGTAVKDAMIKLTDQLKPGWEIVSVQTYTAGTMDFRPILQLIKEANPDYLHTSPYLTDGALIVKQAREIGLDIPLQVSAACSCLDFLQLTGRDALGVYVAVEYWADRNYPNPTLIHEMATECWNRYHVAMDKDIMAAYIGTYFVSKAVEDCESLNSKKIRDSLATITIDIPFFANYMHFYPNGQFTWTYHMAQVQEARPNEPWQVEGLTLHTVFPHPYNSTVPILGLKP